jgi:hypothetical protein
MIMRSPIVAMLWENWRLSRVEAAQRLGLGLVGGAAALVLMSADSAPKTVFWLLVTLNAFFYMSIAKLNGGRFIDGYKPGFPLYLYYTRPVPTAAFVGVGMAYDAITGAASYILCAALLGYVFNQPLPLFSIAFLLATFHLAYLAVQWSTRNRIVQWIASMIISWPPFFLLMSRAKSLPEFGFSVAEYVTMALICIVSICIAIAGVARQRRGDAVEVAPRAVAAGGSGGYPDWMISLLRFPCPTSSPTRAQIWFELQSSGLPILAIGVSIAIFVFLLYAIGIAIVPVRDAAIAAPLMFGIPVVLLVFGGNAFGIRKKQGRTYASTFEATKPYGTAQMAGLKILVRTACVLAALVMVLASIWLSTSLLSTWGSWVVAGKESLPGLLEAREEIGKNLGGLSAYAYAILAILLSCLVASVVTSLATFTALRARYPRHVLVAGVVLLLSLLALILHAWAAKSGFSSLALLSAHASTTGWILLAAVVLGTAYIAWRVLAERLFTPPQALGVLLFLALIGAAWVTLLLAAGVSLTDMFAAEAFLKLAPMLLPLIFIVLAPWSLSRVRHT